MADLEQRPRRGEDRVVSTGTAAAMLGRTRQAVDDGLRSGRIEGFRDPGTRRLWVDRDWLERQLPANHELARRLGALEDVVGSAAVEVTTLSSALGGVGSFTPSAAAQNVTLRAVALELLAALADQDRVRTLLEEAERLEEKARSKRRKAAKIDRESGSRYRDALSQTLLPGAPPLD